MQSKDTRNAVVGGGLLLLFGALLLIQEFVEISSWIWVGVLIASGLGVYGVYSIAREESWMLILSYVLLAIGIMIALVTGDILEDAYIATYVMAAIAIPFIFAYFRGDRTNWGLLIPAYVLIAVGVMVPLLESETLTETYVPAYVLFAVALPFLVVFIANTKQWWALIVGGIIALVGVSILFASDLAEYVTPVALILVGGGILVRLITKRGREEASEEQVSET